jgi:hypothetical protein
MPRFHAAVAGVALALVACQSSSVDRTGKTTRGFYSPDYATVWEQTAKVLRRNGFTPDPDASGPTTMVTRWNTQLHPFSHKGTREQATVYLREIEGQANHWSIETNVIRQVNRNLKEPTNPIRADWGGDERVPETEDRITHDVETFFLGYDVSPEFRATYGMPAARPEIPAPAATGGTPGSTSSTR